MSEKQTSEEQITFEPPGPGSWMLDTTHHGRRPLTRYIQPLYVEAFTTGMPTMLERYGLPLKEFRVALVHGCFYVRPMGIGEPESPGKEPPTFVLKIVSRLHPQLRRRNRLARQAWSERRWRDDVDQWFGTDRARVVAANVALGSVELDGLDDDALVAHLAEVTRNLSGRAIEAFETHGGDLVPVGDYLAHCARWGIDLADASALLEGSSPASVETVTILAPVTAALAHVSPAPDSVEAVRALGPEVDEAVTEWLTHHGWRLIASDDLDSPTLQEQPALALRALLAAAAIESSPEVSGGALSEGVDSGEDVRSRVPAAEAQRFDELLAEARYGLRLRDDNVGVRWNWSAGLVRRALLEVGRRLAERGALTEADHVLELDADEVSKLMTGAGGPDGDEVAERWRRREAVIASNPPSTLGPESAPPPLDAFPAPLARATAAIMALIDSMNGEPSAEPLHGTGVGALTATGRALVVGSPTDAFSRLRDGDIVIAPFTGPAWNSLLPMLSAIVVEEGGPMCHAAIVAREFGIPALVGVTDATRLVPDGAMVEVDAVAGRLRVVEESGPTSG